MLQFCQWRQKQKVSNTSNNCWYTLIYTFGYIKHMRWLYQSDAKWSGKWKMWKCQSAKVNEVRMKSTRVINLGLDSCHLPWRCRGQAIKPCEASQNFWNTSKHFFHSFSACSASARRMNWGTCQTCHQLVFASWCHHCLQLGEFIDNWRRQRLHAANASVNSVRRCRLVSILSWLNSSWCVLSPQLSVPNSKMWHNVTEAHPRQSQKIDTRWKAQWSGWNKNPKLNHVKT